MSRQTYRALLLGLLATLGVTGALGAVLSYTLGANPDGTRSTAFQCVAADRSDCKAPGAGVLAWGAAIAPLTLTNGASGSRNLRALYLQGSAAATAPITISCTPTLAGGFSAGADGESWSSTTTYSATCQASATDVGAPVVSSFYTITSAPTPADTTPPPYVQALTCADSIGQANCSFDSSADNYEGDGDPPTGTATYKVYLDGALNQTITVASPTKAPQLTASTIGTPQSPSSSQSGNAFTIISGGDIDDVDGDNTRVFSAATAADFVLSYRIVSVTNNGGTLSKYGAQVRNSLAQTSRYVSGHNQLGTTSQCRRRAIDGGSTSGISQVVQSVALSYRISRTASTVSVDSSADGNAFGTVCSNYADVAFDATALGALFVVGDATHASSTTFVNVNFSFAGRVGFTINTTGPHAVAVEACDAVANCSMLSGAVAINPSAPTDTTPPTRSAQPGNPAASAVAATCITWATGACTDASGVRGHLPFTKTASGGTRTPQAEQSVNSYTQCGLSPSTPYYADFKCVDNLGNVESSFSNEVTATTAASTGDPASAPTITSFVQNADRSASYTLEHSLVANAHHYNVQVADCADGQRPGTYVPVGLFEHTTATSTLSGFAIADAKSIRVQAANEDNSVAFTSSPSDCKPIQEPHSTVIDWNPGRYAEFRRMGDDTTMRTYLQTIANLPSPWTGVILDNFMWGQLETGIGTGASNSESNPTTGAGYEKGFASLDAWLAMYQAAGKHFVLGIGDKYPNANAVINPSDSAYASRAPLYLRYKSAYANPSDPAGSGGLYFPDPGFSGDQWSSIARLWDPHVAERMAQLVQAICIRYNTNPTLEGIQLTSTSISATATQIAQSGYSSAGYLTGVKTVLARGRQYCGKKNIWMRIDFVGNHQLALDFMRFALGWRIGLAEYDTTDWDLRIGDVEAGNVAKGTSNGIAAFMGAPSTAGDMSLAGTAGVDLRGKLPLQYNLEPYDIDRAVSQYGFTSLNEVHDIWKGMKATHPAYYIYDFGSTPTGFTPQGQPVWNNVFKPCVVASSDLPGCTISIRDQAVYSTYPTEYIQP